VYEELRDRSETSGRSLVCGCNGGSGIALLYAPQSGARTKKDIKKFARKTVDRLDDLQEEIRDNVADWVDDMTQVVTDGVDRGKKLGAEGYEQVLQGFDNAKKCVEDGRSRIEQLIKTV
jgi:gas vesicle protein